MIISSVIKDQKDLLKILASENKQIIFLISVGQEYHENESMRASVQTIYDLIHASANTKISDIADPEMKKRIHGTWTITVIVGDEIQAYNHAHDEKSLAEQQAVWSIKGDEWILRNKPIVESLKVAGGELVNVEVQFIKWREFLARAQSFHFNEYYELLCNQYAKDKGSQFTLWTNHKAHRHAYRKTINAAQATSHVQDEWKKTPVTNQYKLKYLLEEFALLLGCISSGLLVGEHKKRFKSISTTLLYPSNEEQAFRHARNLLIKYAEAKQYCFDYAFSWHSLYLLQVVDPSFLVVSNSEVQQYKPVELSKHQEQQQKIVSKVYFEFSDERGKMNRRFPTWSFTPTNYIKKTNAYCLLESTATQANIVVLSGGSGTGKSCFVQEYCLNHFEDYSKFIWIERENIDKTFIESIAAVTRQLKLSDAESDEMAIEKSFRQYLSNNPDVVVIFKLAHSYQEIEKYISDSNCKVFITTHVLDPNAWIDEDGKFLKRIHVKGFEQHEAQRLFCQITQCNQVEMINAVCQYFDDLPALVHLAAVLFIEQAKDSSYSIDNFYECLVSECSGDEQKSINKKSAMLWKNTLRLIESREKVNFEYPMVIRLLEIWSFLSKELNPQFFAVLFNPEYKTTPDIRPPLNQLNFVLKELEKLAVISRRDDGTCILSKNLQRIMRQDLIARKKRVKTTKVQADLAESQSQWLDMLSLMVMKAPCFSEEERFRQLAVMQKNVEKISDTVELQETLEISMISNFLNRGEYVTVFENAKKLIPIQVEKYCIEKQVKSLVASNHQAIALYNSGDFQGALKILNEMFAKSSRDVSPSPGFWSENYFLCFKIHTAKGQINEATEAIKNVFSCMGETESRRSFTYRLHNLLFTSSNNPALLFLFLQLIQAYQTHYSNIKADYEFLSTATEN